MSAAVLRPATQADVARLTEVVRAAYGHYVGRLGGPPRPLTDDYAQVVRDFAVTVAEVQSEIAGLIVLGIGDEGFLVDNVAVSPSHQGAGVGRALLEHAEAAALAAGFDSIHLYTHEKMTENIALYERVGYVEYDRRRHGHATLVYMRKPLGLGAETFRAPAEAYDRFIGRYGPRLASALISFAGVGPGMRAIDVGCGPGALAAALTERLGEARVSAADPSAQFVEACRARLPGVDVVLAPAEALPYADGDFDAAVSQLVVNFMDDPEAGVREMARVTRRGGTVAACVWDYAGEMTLLRAYWDAAREVVPELAAAADEGVVMPWCAAGELAELWRLADLDSIRSDSLVVSANYAGFEDLWAPLPTGIGPAGAFCRSLDESDQAALRAALRKRLGVGDGPFELTARAWAVAGTVR